MAYEYWFHTPLTCLACGAIIAPQQAEVAAVGLNPDPHGRWVEPGEVLPVTLDDFGAAFFLVRNPPPGEALRALASWACPVSGDAQWARLTFERVPEGAGIRFLGATSVPLTAEEAAGAHFVDADVVRSALAAPPGAGRDALLAILAPAVAAAARDARLPDMRDGPTGAPA